MSQTLKVTWMDSEISGSIFWRCWFGEKLLWTISGDFDEAKVWNKLQKNLHWDLKRIYEWIYKKICCGYVRLPPDLFSSQLNGSPRMLRLVSAPVTEVLAWLLPESRVCDRHELSLTLMFKSYRWTHLTELKTYFRAPLRCFSRHVAQKRWRFELWLCKNYKWYEKVELFWGSPEICEGFKVCMGFLWMSGEFGNDWVFRFLSDTPLFMG